MANAKTDSSHGSASRSILASCGVGIANTKDSITQFPMWSGSADHKHLAPPMELPFVESSLESFQVHFLRTLAPYTATGSG